MAFRHPGEITRPGWRHRLQIPGFWEEWLWLNALQGSNTLSGLVQGLLLVSQLFHLIRFRCVSWAGRWLRVIQHCALEVEAWWSRVTSLFLHSLLKFPPDCFNLASLCRSETSDKDQEKGQIFISRFSNTYHPGLYPLSSTKPALVLGHSRSVVPWHKHKHLSQRHKQH